MDFFLVKSLEKRKKADALVLPFWQKNKGVEPAADCSGVMSHIKPLLSAGDFKGRKGETVVLYPGGVKEYRMILLGLGKKKDVSLETFRYSYSALVKVCHKKKKIQSLNMVFPQHFCMKEAVRGLAEGLFLTNYTFDELKQSSLEKAPVLLEKITFIAAERSVLASVRKAESLCDGVKLARDLVNANADKVTPQYLATFAKGLSKRFSNVKTTVFNKNRIEKEGMGLFLAVNRGSSNDPAFIIMEYKGAPRSKDRTVLVGKGVTYDTGGLNLKPTGSIETMKCDMAGSAAAFGTLFAAATMSLKVNLTIVVAATENSIDAKSYKPGDVYRGYAGKTVEIGNTDAEGRLTLADALAYSVSKLSPTRIIDLATLTGAIVIALGEETIGIMSNDDDLASKLSYAGEVSYERVCRLPLYEEYREQLKSEIADLNNVGGRSGGSITAGVFLQEFVGKIPWVHCDIAGTAYLSKARRYNPKNATGSGVRLMIEFLESLT